MMNNRHQLYFAIAIIAILATGGFVMLEISDTMTELVLIEGSSDNVVRNGDARLSVEINSIINEIELDVVDEEFKAIDEEINTL